MTTRIWLPLVTLAGMVLAYGYGLDHAWFEDPPPPLVDTPEAVAAGRAFFAARCAGCHRDVALDKRIAGWSLEKSWQVLGRLPAVPRSHMPPFPGTPQERAEVSAFMAAWGAGKASWP